MTAPHAFTIDLDQPRAGAGGRLRAALAAGLRVVEPLSAGARTQ